MQWFILYVRGGKEDEVITYLKEQGLYAFSPQMEMIYRKLGKPYKVTKKMFPNYLFIESDCEYIQLQKQLQEVIKQKEAIVKELKFDNEGTQALHESEKAFIESLMDENKVMGHSVGYIEGDKVVVSEGPLMGYESKIVKVDRHKRRAVLEVEMLNQLVRLSVSLELITKI